MRKASGTAGIVSNNPNLQFIDVVTMPAPANPPAGITRIYSNGTSGYFAVTDSIGNSLLPPATSIAPGTIIDGGTY